MADVVIYTTPPCDGCGKRSVMALPLEGHEAWRRGTLIQDAFPDPDWTAGQREQIKTGWHPSCWSAMFGDGDE